MKVQFKYYLHDDAEDFREEVLEDQIGLNDLLSPSEMDELAEKIGRPFYEVTLDCVLDTVTGEVEVLKFNL